MTKSLTLATAIVGLAGAAQAGGIDRSGQPMDLLFKDGNYLEFTAVRTIPDVSGTDIAQSPPGFPIPYDSGVSYNDVADAFNDLRFGIKYDFNEKFSLAFMGGEDYGVDILYPEETGSLLGGTLADANSYALALVGRYHVNENFSLHAGVRRQTADGKIGLGGLAYGRVSGYEVNLSQDSAWGYIVGGAYERPEIGLRVALTYNSKITHSFKTTETLNGASLGNSKNTDVDIPQSVNLDFQTGVAEDTLVFGQIRWVDHSQFTVDPEFFTALTGTGLVKVDNSTTYTLGVGHRFTDQISASIAYIYDDVYGDDLVSPLAPTHGSQALRLGATYRVNQVEFAAGLRYTWLGDAFAETGTPDVARADFSGNSAVSVGLRVGYFF
ncbi:outer membrane protein transport protein [Fluviibacterium sp. DFM31]|uniref:Outer membrane protein transport protein n=1 Tax=Meridianimarinicoccus marinus TaxID=3231483 RepID=A0ABV3L527_9RHOB